MTRTSRARIRPFTRNCGCRLNQAPGRCGGSAPLHRVSLSRISGATNSSPKHSASPRLRGPRRGARNSASRLEVVSNICALARPIYLSILLCSSRRCAEMRGMRRINHRVVEHAIERGDKRLQLHHSGKDRAIADFCVDEKRRSLRDLKRVEFRGR